MVWHMGLVQYVYCTLRVLIGPVWSDLDLFSMVLVGKVQVRFGTVLGGTVWVLFEQVQSGPVRYSMVRDDAG